MKTISAIRYRDASYGDFDTTANGHAADIYVALGVLSRKGKDHLMCFTKKNNKPHRGLLLPRGSMVRKTATSRPKRNIARNNLVGVKWEDVVHFDNGSVPSSCPVMYTEGRISSFNRSHLIIADPETIKLQNGKRISNHPKIKPKIYIIPLGLTREITIYEKG